MIYVAGLGLVAVMVVATKSQFFKEETIDDREILGGVVGRADAFAQFDCLAIGECRVCLEIDRRHGKNQHGRPCDNQDQQKKNSASGV